MFYEWLGFVVLGFIALGFVAVYGVILGVALTILWWCRWLIVLFTALFFLTKVT